MSANGRFPLTKDNLRIFFWAFTGIWAVVWTIMSPIVCMFQTANYIMIMYEILFVYWVAFYWFNIRRHK
jgi:hypothetical protein